MYSGKVKVGMRVKITAQWDGTEGIIIDYVPGRVRDFWQVQRDNGTIGIYSFNEFEQISE